MAVYTFENTKTGETYTLEMSMSERQPYLDNNPDVMQLLTTMNLVDPVGIGVTKPPADFQKHVLGRIRDNAAGADKSQFEKRFTIPREF